MRAAVEKIVLNDAGRAISVQLEDDDKVILAKRGVVSAAGCLQTLKLLPEAARREVEWADAILNPASEDFVEQGISHLSLFVGFDTTAAELDLPSQNQWCVSGSGETAKAWHALPDGAAAAARGDLGTYFVGFPSAKDPSARASKPATCSIISETNEAWWRPWADSPPHKRPEAYEALKKAFEERMLAKLYELFPQCEGRVVFSKLGTSLTNDHYLKRAASYGLAPTPKRYASPKMAAIRPEVAEIPGLFITGQDVTTAGWAGALMSGVMTAMAILGYGFLDLAVFNRDLVTDLMRVTDAADQADKKAS
jgi:all-trans-retinol 13,14-reductase